MRHCIFGARVGDLNTFQDESKSKGSQWSSQHLVSAA